MVSVELPSSRRKRDTSDTALAYGYEISLSNDRQSFDEGYSKNIIVRKLRYQRFYYLSPIGEIL
jgi:hypothetical protein